jgi:transcriptional regulator with XRE-family HTH domain
MDDSLLGFAIRTLRVRKRWRQQDLASVAEVSRQLISEVERGHLDHVTTAAIRRIVAALGARVMLRIDTPGRDLDRLLSARHALMHEEFARRYGRLPEWQWVPEGSFSFYGERGVIDVLGWHAAAGMVLIVELKTAIVDVNDLMASMDRRRRLGFSIARERGWTARFVSSWVLVADSATAHRRLADHTAVLRTAFPSDGRRMRSWLRRPSKPVAALSFLSDARLDGAGARYRPSRAVRLPNAARERAHRA